MYDDDRQGLADIRDKLHQQLMQDLNLSPQTEDKRRQEDVLFAVVTLAETAGLRTH